MIEIDSDITSQFQKITDGMKSAAEKVFRKTAARIRKTAIENIQEAPRGQASKPGDAPHTHRGRFLERAIRYDANKDGALIGPVASVVGEAGQLHEFGLERGGIDYPERPFMGPALDQNLSQFADEWRDIFGT